VARHARDGAIERRVPSRGEHHVVVEGEDVIPARTRAGEVDRVADADVRITRRVRDALLPQPLAGAVPALVHVHDELVRPRGVPAQALDQQAQVAEVVPGGDEKGERGHRRGADFPIQSRT
jgi:hypothetical protein